jgi:hypothetical protein
MNGKNLEGIEVLTQNLLRQTEENHEKSQDS